MSAYAKFLKEILSSKRKLEETTVVKLNAYCTAILQNKIPQNCGDLGSFNIPCSLGSEKFDKSLCDSGAFINLMPLSMFKKLEGGLEVIKSVPMSLQLADQTTIFPEGIIDDILVRVDRFVFPVDFIVVGMEVNKEVPLITIKMQEQEMRLENQIKKGKQDTNIDEILVITIIKS
ncbi:uncharacterized protein LOC107801156 [Nicotiana tabacum]|uniref:Uncharacterized protein LOC107801156 n=2 Tax=Nicotiana TaxID=4085 RepID=A0A1S4ATL3_TOBAC|nr:PREDICTED: uncharacterized protein LOC104234471 [Nicotiana sylvestris]XP_016479926.1 PREDICTED: uncharacterized protein LOC107801156 [Nicotiana tabacum]